MANRVFVQLTYDSWFYKSQIRLNLKNKNYKVIWIYVFRYALTDKVLDKSNIDLFVDFES